MNESDIFERLSNRYSINYPSYYSYPTIVNFKDYDDSIEKKTIRNLTDKNELSIYIHIPFCQKLCYYCGCSKEISKDRNKGVEYTVFLIKEMELYSNKLKNTKIKKIHFGGGSPDFLRESQYVKIFHALNNFFHLSDDIDISIEVDPRYTECHQILFFEKCGVSRISLGIQDLNHEVQVAINRVQDINKVQLLIELARKLKFKSISIDLIYGLPLQTITSFSETIDKVIHMDITKIQLSKYAHVPNVFASQKKLERFNFPSEIETIVMFSNAKKKLIENGYHLVGIDHFVKEEDPLLNAAKNNKIIRNYMGYEEKNTSDTLSFGVSAMSFIDGDFYINTRGRKKYYQKLRDNKSPIEKYTTCSDEDKMIRFIINEILCYKKIDFSKIDSKLSYNYILKTELMILKKFEEDGLVTLTGSVMTITKMGELYVKNICSIFDPRIRPLIKNKLNM